jgi:hypothetical protein
MGPDSGTGLRVVAMQRLVSTAPSKQGSAERRYETRFQSHARYELAFKAFNTVLKIATDALKVSVFWRGRNR